MAIVQYLLSLDPKKLPPKRRVHLDDIQEKVRKNLFLELPQTDGTNCLISPTLTPMGNNDEERIRRLLSEKPDVLNYFKDRLINTLVLETAILETASYFIQQNDYLLLAL